MIGPADLRGIWGFALTPFDSNDRVDVASFRAGVRRLVDGGADVVVSCGTLGQGDRMTAFERVTCLADAVAETGAAVPVLSVLSASEAPADEAARIVAAGADGALLLPASGDPRDAAAAIAAIDEASRGRLPVVLYQRGGLRLSVADLRQMAESRALVGLKDALGDLRLFRQQQMALGDRLVWVCASEDLAVAYQTHGADAVAPASMAYAPGYARRWWAALERGDADEAVRLLRVFAWPLTDLRMSRPDIDTTVVHDLARLFGSWESGLRAPARALDPAESAALAELATALRLELQGVMP